MTDLKEEIKKADEGELIQVKPSATCTKGNHVFVQVSGTEAECPRCHVGYGLGVGAEVKDGHIYIQGELVL